MFWDCAEKETSSIPTTRPRDAQTRSFNCVLPLLRAQWTQQKICPSASTPCPTIRQLQCAQTGASAWMAHSKLSKVWCSPPTTTSNALSYSLSQTSHVAIHNVSRAGRSVAVFQSVASTKTDLSRWHFPDRHRRYRLQQQLEIPQESDSFCLGDCSWKYQNG